MTEPSRQIVGIPDLNPPDTCECGTRLKDGWCGTCREFIWRIR